MNFNSISYIILILIIGCLSCQSNVSSKETDISKLELLGNVKSFLEYSYLDDTTYTKMKIPNFDQLVQNKQNLSANLKKTGIADLNYYIFNRSGQTKEELIFHSDIDQNTILNYTYDKFGNKTEKTISQFDGEIYSRITFAYNNDHKIIEQKEFERDTVYTFKSTFHYNNRNLLKQEKRYNKEGKLFLEYFYNYNADNNIIEVTDKSTTTIFHYDDRTNLIERVSFDKNENINKHLKLEYDSIGNIIKKYHLDTWLEINNTKTYKYDSSQNLIQSCIYNEDSILVAKQFSTYDSNGILYKQVIKNYRYNSGPIKTKIRVFNEFGNASQVINISEVDSILDSIRTYFKYSYDQHGNILKIENSRSSRVEFREIDYY